MSAVFNQSLSTRKPDVLPTPASTVRRGASESPAPGPLRFKKSAQPAARYSRLRDLRLLVVVIFFSVISYFVVNRYCIAAVIVQGRSMNPTLQDGDRCLLNRLSLLYRAPARSDLAVIKDPGHTDFAIKRIIGLPGDTIHIKDGYVFLNGNRLVEPYLAPGMRTICLNSRELYVKLKPSQYFLLGDNRGDSEDSRYYGPIDRGQIQGTLIP
jgi:signal peptidase I